MRVHGPGPTVPLGHFAERNHAACDLRVPSRLARIAVDRPEPEGPETITISCPDPGLPVSVTVSMPPNVLPEDASSRAWLEVIE